MNGIGGRDGETDKDRLIEELREAVRARDEFVAIAAHELRNPMTPILMQVGGLLAAARDPRRCRPELLAPRLEILELAVREFVRRSTALLDVSRIAAGNVRIEPAEVDLTGVVRGVVDRAGMAARLARCPLETDLQEGVVGTWDRLALEQVAENLLSNAIKFGAGKPVTVALTSDSRTARLTVRDRGIGISEADRARIFGRFERAVTRREHGGFGIGLWLANQLVLAMGGTIAVEGAPGEGTTFTVTLLLGGSEQQGSGAWPK
ncbi:sensor histidine kinase [Paracraurococcus lichenis]|uniref:histidine kinase n=1 Tax=Paracraurococcus lichenis TaxID=3064888 RepID=A0ABT9ECS9_9PROT|nr:HAMP domain-containing sensor histidine kinase [Paracraurococcus sp. LOR1-02]MDO9714018.1 HAMP domain-containing sensor histidine kinase [Paracraurococcus sp. LOR1-02]